MLRVKGDDVMNLKEIFQQKEYGYLPETPKKIDAEVLEHESASFLAGKADRELIKLSMEVNGKPVSFPFHFVYQRGKKNVKTMICINFRSPLFDKYVPVEEIIDDGWNLAVVYYNDITKDDGVLDENGKKLKGFVDDNYIALRGKESKTAPGKIMMWAWGCMRVLDYLLTREQTDAKNVGVCGHSRLGKTALVTAAFDDRFAFAHSNCSGRCGANLFKYDDENSEHVSDIVNNLGYWFCDNFHDYVGNEEKIDFDQDELVSMIAPRVVSVGSAVEDLWANPKGEFECVKSAYKTWEKMGYPKVEFPENAVLGEKYQEGKAGYYLRAGKHFFSRSDWNSFLPFFDRNLNK